MIGACSNQQSSPAFLTRYGTRRMVSRAFRLSMISAALEIRARELASDGEQLKAMRALALADALHHAAGGDDIGKRIALSDAKHLKRAMLRIREHA